MIRKTLLLFLLFISIEAKSQIKIDTISQIKIDTIIKSEILESHFSYKYHNPVFIVYKIYKGGGNCNRSKFVFRTGDVKNSATSTDSLYSGYDKGHLANAEDFAYDCIKDSLTFFYYNAVPQTPNLNRGCWETYESRIRNISQSDSLLVICGSIFSDYKIPNTNIYIPIYCWKVVQSLSTKNIIYVLLFTNESKSSVKTGL